MKTATRVIAALLVTIMISTTIGCSGSPTTAAKYEDAESGFSIEVPTGVYISCLIDSYRQAEVKIPDYTKKLFHKDQEIDGKSTKDWIVDEAISKVKQYVFINKMHKELNLDVPQDEIDYMTNIIDEAWNENAQIAVYPDNGVSKESVIKYFATMDFYTYELFKSLYGKGGSREVPEQELKDLFDEKYMRIKLMSARLFNSKGEKLSDNDIEHIRSTMQGYVDRINNGEDFDKVFKDYDLWNEERVFKLEKPDEEFEPAEREEDKDTSEMTPEELEEYIASKGIEQIFSRDEKSNQMPPAIFDKFNSLPIGTAELWTNDEYYFVLQRLDMNERQSLFDRYYEVLLSGYKSEEYQEYIKSEADKLDIKIDEQVISKNNPKKLIFPPAY